MKIPDWKSKLEETKTKISSSANDIAQAGNQKLREKFNDAMIQIAGLQPILNESGFMIGDIYLTASITPSIGIIIEQKEQGRILLNNIECDADLTAFQRTVLNSIKKIYDLNDLIEQHNHTIGQLDISLGISPEVTAHLNSVNSRAFSTSEVKSDNRDFNRIESPKIDL